MTKTIKAALAGAGAFGLKHLDANRWPFCKDAHGTTAMRNFRSFARDSANGENRTQTGHWSG